MFNKLTQWINNQNTKLITKIRLQGKHINKQEGNITPCPEHSGKAVDEYSKFEFQLRHVNHKHFQIYLVGELREEELFASGIN